MEMMKLKVATDRMAGYTGVLGPVRFTDGVSDEYLPRHIRDRMSAAMPFIEIDADGNEQDAGAQNRMIRENTRGLIQSDLGRQSEEEKAAEVAANQILVAKVPQIETRESLEAIASKGGIKALREIGKKWAVKHRSIPVLIEMILEAQEKALIKRNKTETPAVETPAVVEDEANTAEDSTIDPAVAAEALRLEAEEKAEQEEMTKQAALRAAAATGDLSAAINAETLLGSSVLASTYDIAGQTVQLGDIVASAFDRFGGTIGEWNALEADAREDLLRLDLDQRLAAE